MGEQGGMGMKFEPEQTWVLSEDRQKVRFKLPPLRVAGQPQPLIIHLNFDREAVEQLLERLTTLYSKMVPPRASRN
jgi:hypothetical protein